MNAPALPEVPMAPGGLHARRCVRHPSREAAARCPGCSEFFCRECVTEHEGKLLCARCLARAAAGEAGKGRRQALLRRALAVMGGVAVLWLLFYTAGVALLKIPPDFHDGTAWAKPGRTNPP